MTGVTPSWNNTLKIVQEASWKNLMEVRQSINSLSGGVKRNFTVFNIGGNDFRLITIISFEKQTILITDIFTHAEYSAINGTDYELSP